MRVKINNTLKTHSRVPGIWEMVEVTATIIAIRVKCFQLLVSNFNRWMRISLGGKDLLTY